jgi:four helix bundle protein
LCSRIYEVIRQYLRLLRPLIARTEKHDRDLARQLRRAGASMLLNTGEGSGNRGGTRRERYSTALGSSRESLACVHAAEDRGYVVAVDPAIYDLADQIIGTIARLVLR